VLTAQQPELKTVQSLKSNVQSHEYGFDFGHWTLDFGLVSGVHRENVLQLSQPAK
jgi:hypothetical protein